MNATFYRIAADLSGVVLTKPEIEVSQAVVSAQIIDYKAENEVKVEMPSEKKKKSKCEIF